MRKSVPVAVYAVLLGALAPQAGAIPAFARRYGAECSYCHEGFPKLNYEGQRFKERGFRMPAEDAFDASKWINSVPLVGRGWANRFLVEDGKDSTTGYLKTISAGNLGKRLSYWADDAFLITQGNDNFTHLKPDNVWVRLELVGGEKLYLKAGRFELDLPFTQARSPHLLSYDVYSTATGFEVDNIGTYQEGAELGGGFAENWRWSAAIVKGRNNARYEANSDDADKFDGNVFLRVRRRADRHRFGAFAYVGRNTLAPTNRLVFKNDLQRYGVDADGWFGKLNLYGVYLHGQDSNPWANTALPQGTKVRQTFDGGFLQADWHALNSLVLSARLNVVERPTDLIGAPKQTFRSFFPGARLYLFKHARVALEYGFLNQGRKSFGSAQAELVF